MLGACPFVESCRARPLIMPARGGGYDWNGPTTRMLQVPARLDLERSDPASRARRRSA